MSSNNSPANPWKWALALLTSNWRPQSTLQRTLESYRDTGFAPPIVFADLDRKCDIWNWYRAMRYLVRNIPDADAYAIIEDDVVFAKDIRTYLENTLWPEVGEDGCICSLFTPTLYANENTWSKVNLGVNTWGSLFRIYHPVTARKIIRDITEYADFQSRERQNDEIIGKWLEQHDVGIWYHHPSLAQHTGLNLTSYDQKIGYGTINGLSRNFVGEYFSVVMDLKKWHAERKPYRKISLLEIPIGENENHCWTSLHSYLLANQIDRYNCDIDWLFFVADGDFIADSLAECVEILRLTGKVHHIGFVTSNSGHFDFIHQCGFQSCWINDHTPDGITGLSGSAHPRLIHPQDHEHHMEDQLLKSEGKFCSLAYAPLPSDHSRVSFTIGGSQLFQSAQNVCDTDSLSHFLEELDMISPCPQINHSEQES